MASNISNKKIPVNFIISNIRIIDSTPPPVEFIDFAREDLTYSISFKFATDINLNLIGVTIDYSFMHKGEIIHAISTLNEYKIIKPKITELEKNTEAFEKILSHLAALSLGHSRGLQSTIIDNTAIKSMYIPTIAPSRLKALIK